MLIIVCGLQGTGKSTIAKNIAKKTHSILLRTDIIRRELFKAPKYTEDEKQKTYQAMFSRAHELLQKHKNIVLDATFAKQENRSRAKKIAEIAKARFLIVEVICDENIVKRRMKKRLGDASRAQFEQHLEYKKLFDPIQEEHIIINNSGHFEEIQKQLEAL